MVWLKIDNYCIKCGDFYIAKYFTPFGEKFGVSHHNKSFGYFNTAHEAKQKALEVNNGQ
jgi:hypothetical protein